MIHHVRTNRRDYWQLAPKAGLLMFALLLCAPLLQPVRHLAPVASTLARLESATRDAVRLSANAELYAQPDIALYKWQDATRVSREEAWRTWSGEYVLTPVSYVSPQTDLARSPYGDAHWSPWDDSITFEPFIKPTLGYFVGQVYNATTKNNYQTALNSAQPTDIVELNLVASYTRSSPTPGGSLSQIIFPPRSSGYVMVRDGGTFGVLPADGVRVTDAAFAASHRQTAAGSDSIWDFAPQTQGWFFLGIDLDNSHNDNVRLLGILPRNTTTGQYAINLANNPKYIIVQQSRIENAYDPAWTVNCRNGIDPSCEFFYITENIIRGISSNQNESKGINTSQSIGKANVTNNDIEGMTETIMWGGALMLGDNPNCGAADIYIARNFLHRRPEWMVYSATAFYYRNHKNFEEIKHGERQVWERNECWGHSGIGQQQDLQIKHAGQGPSDQGKVRCRNVLFRYQRFENSATPISIATSTNSTYTPNGTERVEVYGTLWFNQHPPYVTNSGNRNLFSDMASNVKIIADVYVHHNTYSARNNTMALAGNTSTNAGSLPNFRWMNNVDYSPVHTNPGSLYNAGVKGVTAMNNVSGVGGWNVGGNVGIGSAGSFFASLPGTYEVTAGALNFVDAANGNYTLVDYSAYPGTDGGAPGMNYSHLVSLLTGVLTGAAA